MIQTFALKSMNISAVSTLNNLNIGLTTYKDLMIYLDMSAPSAPTMSVRRRNAEGAYLHVANITAEIPSPYSNTNGKWIAILPFLNSGGGATLVTIDDNNNISNSSFIAGTVGGFLLSDDTFVGFDPQALDDGNYTIRTYQYESSDNTWNEIAGTQLLVTSQVSWQGDYSSYRATDTHLTVAVTDSYSGNITVMIYERQANKSWTFMDSLPVNSSFGQPAGVNFNGMDTVIVTYPMFVVQADSTYGVAFLYTKNNGVWSEEPLRVLDLGYRPVGLLGTTTIFIDANTLLVSVALDGYGGGGGALGNAGKILMLTRNSTGNWQPSLDLVGGSGLFGLGLSVSDRDVIVASLTSYNGNGYFFDLYSGPLCFTEPINVTCHEEQVNECSQVLFSELYTVNNPQCGAVSATMDSFSLVNNQAVQVQYSFSKGFGPSVTCNATVTCPAPPVAPVSNVVAAPTKVSSAGATQVVGFASLLLTALALM